MDSDSKGVVIRLIPRLSTGPHGGPPAQVTKLLCYAPIEALRGLVKQAAQEAVDFEREGNRRMRDVRLDDVQRFTREAELAEANAKAWADAERESDHRWTGAAFIVERANKARREKRA